MRDFKEGVMKVIQFENLVMAKQLVKICLMTAVEISMTQEVLEPLVEKQGLPGGGK